MLKAIKQKINIKYFMVIYLIILIIYAILPINAPLDRLNGVAMVIFYMFFDVLWTYVFDRTWFLPVSALISGCILGLISVPDLPLIWVVLMPVIAVFSKHLLYFGKSRHLLNSAALALTIAGFFSHNVTWWGTNWSPIPMLFAFLVGAIILWKLQRVYEAIAFLISYALFLCIYLLISGSAIENLPALLNVHIINGTLLFFVTVMLIDPVTSEFPTRKNQITYAVLVGFFAIMATAIFKLAALNSFDPLLVGLLLGNLTAGLVFLPNKLPKRSAPKLKTARSRVRRLKQAK